ncbi:RNA-directed RNA polymerase [Penicillium argentinense]|uniref:RNA-directed RNA polymerase n=1 Tax=Penicillium argentinense TaxID=1131581 RepID=A0A9W9ENE2_9EURO|nr:RNA-directed RNA polymerase [Penicillium argentinense]KAJ5085012.1 RNA-directed RNA polymerase [Penicillium argentinense]
MASDYLYFKADTRELRTAVGGFREQVASQTPLPVSPGSNLSAHEKSKRTELLLGARLRGVPAEQWHLPQPQDQPSSIVGDATVGVRLNIAQRQFLRCRREAPYAPKPPTPRSQLTPQANGLSLAQLDPSTDVENSGHAEDVRKKLEQKFPEGQDYQDVDEDLTRPVKRPRESAWNDGSSGTGPSAILDEVISAVDGLYGKWKYAVRHGQEEFAPEAQEAIKSIAAIKASYRLGPIR